MALNRNKLLHFKTEEEKCNNTNIKRQITDLEAELKIIDDQINADYCSIKLAISEADKIPFENRIKQREDTKINIAKKIDELNDLLEIKYIKYFENVDFVEQTRKFFKEIEEINIGVFVIQGTEKSGHQFLFDRLKKRVINDNDGDKLLEISFNKDIRNLWGNIAFALDVKNKNDIDEILDNLFAFIVNNNIVISVDGIYKACDDINNIITDFWSIFIARFPSMKTRKKKTILVLFDKTCNTRIDCCNNSQTIRIQNYGKLKEMEGVHLLPIIEPIDERKVRVTINEDNEEIELEIPEELKEEIEEYFINTGQDMIIQVAKQEIFPYYNDDEYSKDFESLREFVKVNNEIRLIGRDFLHFVQAICNKHNLTQTYNLFIK